MACSPGRRPCAPTWGYLLDQKSLRLDLSQDRGPLRFALRFAPRGDRLRSPINAGQQVFDQGVTFFEQIVEEGLGNHRKLFARQMSHVPVAIDGEVIDV